MTSSEKCLKCGEENDNGFNYCNWCSIPVGEVTNRYETLIRDW